jgi:iron(III) transport system substrate-binding protein
MHKVGVVLGLIFSLLTLAPGCSRSGPTVVVYTSVDEVFSRPIAERFEKEQDIKVVLVCDTEETKSTGLINRLIAEKDRPQADVFWSGDPVRTAILKSKGITVAYRSPQAKDLPAKFSDKDGYWTGFSARARVIIYNKNLVKSGEEPQSIVDFLDPRFTGKACMADPLFGSTSMHAAALFDKLGEAEAKKFFEGFAKNGGKILSSNGEVRRRVSNGEFAVGLTDTDDYNEARQEGKPVGVVYPDAKGMGTVIVPNSVVLIAKGPNPELGKKFIDFLLSPEIEQALAKCEAAQMPVRSGVSVPDHVVPLDKLHPMDIHYERLSGLMEDLSKGYLKDWVDRNKK